MPGHVLVLDIGKTLSKLTLWAPSGMLVDRRTRPNARATERGRQVLDVTGIETWLLEQLADIVRVAPVDAIVPVGHGAAAAIVRGDALAMAPVDYEVPIPAALRREYDRQRDPFRHSGSPTLPDGLNLGAQLHALEAADPDALNGTTIMLWPQYWAWWLSGVAASEVTSLGCHSDLWRPAEARPSDLAVHRGWAERLPPLRRAGEVIGTVRPQVAARTGLSPAVRIHCGLHDSNAALLAARGFREIADHEATVLSTGTWFVAMRSPRPGATVDMADLPEGRDCLVNVDAAGRAVPSSRFMGGREIEALTGSDTRRVDIAPDQPMLVDALPRVIGAGAMALPSFAAGFGPFPHGRGRWIAMPAKQDERRAAACLYAALMADAALDLIGSRERILVEGRFAEAQVFVRGLATLRPESTVYFANVHNDVSYGALRLLDPTLQPSSRLSRVEPFAVDLEEYRRVWRAHAEQREEAA